ncbi:hypothetical protein [Flavobacterium sp. '19STA2R22 D10 B1']|uniref:hypothetical protein n=1 Tax=Flavobacterium aerium TaxID=3037261 RepID=UPI00278C7742|nr:hypothetical protein [Flavobacterium sp. '19STA2R22 D10 B1']
MKQIYQMQKIVLAIVFSLLTCCGVFAQSKSTKIKDGTVSSGPSHAKPGAIFELESNNKGMLMSRLTKAQRDAIPAENLTNGLLIFNTTSGCFDYWTAPQDAWMSICGSAPPATISISSTQCSGMVEGGTYMQGRPLNLSNYFTIPITVTQPGSYTISATTTNGYYFGATGAFPNAGSYTLNLQGAGTPNSGYLDGEIGDEITVTLNGMESPCKPHLFVEKGSIDYIVNCGELHPQGSYYIGIPLATSNKLSITVNALSTGYWSINTNAVNGYSFSGSGEFTTTGLQTIEVYGTGTPIASGVNTFTLTSNALTSGGGTCYSIPVKVEAISYAMDCVTATQQGDYTINVGLSPNNTITLPVNVVATGETTITTEVVNGISFTSGPVLFTALGQQMVTLVGSGMPTASGVTSLKVTGTPGAVTTCMVDVNIEGENVAYYMNCGSITIEGNYAPGVGMDNSNTITVPVNVVAIGDYTITSNAVNGVIFSATGRFNSTGNQNVVLHASGVPTGAGSHVYTISSNSTISSGTCTTKAIIFVFRKIKLLGLGKGVFQPGSASGYDTARGLITSPNNFGTNGTVAVEGVTIIDGGFNQGLALRDLINTNNIDIIVLGYSYEPDPISRGILNDFVKNKKGVLIHGQEGDDEGTAELLNTICGSYTVVIELPGILGSSEYYLNPIAHLEDPVINGPFGDLKGKMMGSDGRRPYFVKGLPANTIALAVNKYNPTLVIAFKHKTLGYFYTGNAGWIAGNESNSDNNVYPAKMASDRTPMPKPYYESTEVHNSAMYANTMAWAIKYVQQNTVSTYLVP